MLLPTHLVAGEVFFLGGCVLAGHVPEPGEALMAMVSAVLPDIDHRQGIIGQAFPFLAAPLEYRFGHRSITHSLLVQAVVAILGWFLLPEGFALAIVLGLFSHASMDMATPSGVAWFWPSRVRCVIPGNDLYRVDPMSHGELGVLILLSALSFVLFDLAREGLGGLGLIRSALGELSTARTQYEDHKSGFAFRLRMDGIDNKSLEAITGEFPVIAGYRETGFLIDTPEGTKSVCQQLLCDWHAERAVLVRGEPQQARFMTLKVERTSFKRLREALEGYGSFEAYLVGEARSYETKVGKSLDRPPALTVTGETVHFDHARLADLIDIEGPLHEVALSVQVRFRPGTAVPELPPLAASKEDDVLRRWVGVVLEAKS